MSVGGKGPAARLDTRIPRIQVMCPGDMSTAARAAIQWIRMASQCVHNELYLRGSTLLKATSSAIGTPLNDFDKTLFARAFSELEACGRLQSRGPQAWAIHFEIFGLGFQTAPGVLPPREWILERDEWECQYCFADLRECTPHLDHVFPKSRGGWDDAANVVAACAPCNLKKHDRTPEEWNLSKVHR